MTAENRGRGRVVVSTVILAKRGSPKEGHGSTLLLLSRNQRGDSRAERENDVQILRMHVVSAEEPFGGFFACWRRL